MKAVFKTTGGGGGGKDPVKDSQLAFASGEYIFQQGDPLAGAGGAQHFINPGDRPDLSGGALSGEKKPAPPRKPKG